MGWLGDKLPKRLLVVFGMIVGAAGALFFLMAPGKLWVVIIFALMFSITDGAAGLTWAMIGDFFGRSAYATLRGLITFCVSLGSMATPVIVGRISRRDRRVLLGAHTADRRLPERRACVRRYTNAEGSRPHPSPERERG